MSLIVPMPPGSTEEESAGKAREGGGRLWLVCSLSLLLVVLVVVLES